MIKGITIVRQAPSAAIFDKLSSFFAALGFEPGKGWEEPFSRSMPFLAPLGNFELVDGALPATPEILIEVTGLDSIHQIAAEWLRQNQGAGHGTAIVETHWKSRLFTVEFSGGNDAERGMEFAFWEWSDPLAGKPVAVEGDLSAAGMRFAMVVARWNAVITDRLLQGALDALHRSGARKCDIEIIRVPGAWEIPLAARAVADSAQKPDAIVTLGCLLRGPLRGDL
jgi:6,7-dimethyl-8-ribityllumazine synthase